MPAALLADLVLHVHRGHADALEVADGAADVEGPAPAGVDVHQQGHARGIDDAARVGEHVLHGADAKVGHAQRVGRHAATGQVQRLVAGALGHEAGVGRDRAHHLQRGFFGNGGAETRASRGLSIHAWVSGVFVQCSQFGRIR
jgi:hypothetical protein